MARETLAARRGRYALKQETIRQIAILERATNATFQALTTTRRDCPCCNQPYFPMDTPEYAAYSHALGAERRAICGAVERGDIAENDACVRFGLSVEDIRNGIVLYKITAAREAGDAYQPNGQEETRGADRPNQAP